MKKLLLGALALTVCSLFLFAGCAPSSAPSDTDEELTLTAAGTVTDIVSSEDGTASITVDGSGMESDAVYQLMILHVANGTVVEADGKTDTYRDGMIKVGDTVEAYFLPTAPVTASEPPQGTPEKIVVTASGSSSDVQREFQGTITEIDKDNDYLLVYVQSGEDSEPADDLRAVVSSDTVITSESAPEQALSMDDLAVGQAVTVTTDGRMTFSIPPQANALSIVLHS